MVTLHFIGFSRQEELFLGKIIGESVLNQTNMEEEAEEESMKTYVSLLLAHHKNEKKTLYICVHVGIMLVSQSTALKATGTISSSSKM